MQTNLHATFEMCRLMHPMLRSPEGGVIINISSVAGSRVVQTGAVYAMTKAAIEQLTRYLAVEWAADGIRVNAIAPWYIHTPLADEVLKKDDYKKRTCPHANGAHWSARRSGACGGFPCYASLIIHHWTVHCCRWGIFCSRILAYLSPSHSETFDEL